MIEDSNFQTYQAKLDPTLRVTHDSLIPLEHNGFGVAQGQLNWLEWQNQFIFWLNHTGQEPRALQQVVRNGSALAGRVRVIVTARIG